MTSGIMQPYFFPYLGYFALISKVDQWVVFDVTQFTPKSWMTRNRVLNPSKDWVYISCSVDKGTQSKKIQDITLKTPDKDLETIKNTLKPYYKNAPFYENVLEIIEKTFAAIKSNSLVSLNNESLKNCCKYLKVPYDPIIWSKQKIDLPNIHHSGSWALEICSHIGATDYLNPIGGKDLFNQEEFEDRNINLKFLGYKEFCYTTRTPFSFVDNLSIVDVMMWNDPEEINKQLKKIPVIDN
jgi:hypothetical protein